MVESQTRVNPDLQRDHASGRSLESRFRVSHVNSYACGIDTPGDSAEPFGPSTARLSNSCNTNISSPGGSEITPGSPSQPFLQHHPIHGQNLGNAGMPLRVMKFGGTSVGDASCIGKVVEIIRAASRESKVVVVVSA